MSKRAQAATPPYAAEAGPSSPPPWDEPRPRVGRRVDLLRTSPGVAEVSASHLKTLFRRSTGLPVHEYRVHGELPASQVALEAGFAHQSHMARCMRRVLEVTPMSVMRSSRAR